MNVNNQPAKSGRKIMKLQKIPLEYNAKLWKLHSKPDFGSEETKYE